jgi:epoxyqueuosine reductase QueG
LAVTSTPAFTQQLKQRAHALGFELVGVCPAVAAQGITPLVQWLADGYAGEMSYLKDRCSAY